MTHRTTHVLFARPSMIDGVLHRGIMSTDQPTALEREIDPSLWMVLLFFHGPQVPRYEPNVDVYVMSPTFADQCPDPKVCFTDRDLVDENEYYPIACDKQFDVVFCVNWLPFKRHELMIDALAYAQDAGRPISCLWFGYHYNDEWHGREQMLREAVAKRGVAVTFAETDFDLAEVNRRYAISRCAINCSREEGGPRTMTEAALANIPFIVTRDTFGGSPELLGEQAGLVCDPTPQGIAEAIWHVIDHPDQFSPREWALQHQCRSIALERLRKCAAELAEKNSVAINLDDIGFHGYDWELSLGLVRQAEAAFAEATK